MGYSRNKLCLYLGFRTPSSLFHSLKCKEQRSLFCGQKAEVLLQLLMLLLLLEKQLQTESKVDIPSVENHSKKKEGRDDGDDDDGVSDFISSNPSSTKRIR